MASIENLHGILRSSIYSPAQLALCDQWFSQVETADCWSETGTVLKGESHAFEVMRTTHELLGAAKPAIAVESNGNCRAAHEKLAFDLAHLLDLPVPPVVLWNRGGEYRGNGRFAISAYLFKRRMEWDEACQDAKFTEQMQSRIGRAISAMIPFLIWINDANSTGDHVILDGDRLDANPCVTFIDHAGGMQGGPQWGDTLTSDCFMPKAEYRSPQVIAAVSERIGELSEESIRALVTRIPNDYFVGSEQQYVLCNLLSRKAELPSMINAAATKWRWW